MMSPLVVRKAAAVVEANGSTSSSTITSSCVSSYGSSRASGSPPWSSSVRSGADSGASSPEETSSPRRVTNGQLGSPPASQAAQTLRRLFRKPGLDFKVHILPCK